MDKPYEKLCVQANLPPGSIQDPAPAIGAALKAAAAYPLESASAGAFSHSHVCRENVGFQQAVLRQREKVLSLLHGLIEKIEPGAGNGVCKPLQNNRSATVNDDKLDLEPFTDFLDRLKEAAETAIDDAKGLSSAKQLAQLNSAADGNRTTSASATQGTLPSSVPAKLRAFPQVSNIAKPQVQFPDTIDNSRERPFVSKLVAKEHGMRSSDVQTVQGLAGQGMDGPARISELVITTATELQHPYLHEICSLGYTPSQLMTHPPARFTALDDVQVTYVDTEAGLADMLDYLEGVGEYEDEAASQAASGSAGTASISTSTPLRFAALGRSPVRELAIDLEAHNMRSFQGFTCLMQLSTRERDFLVDTMALRHCLQGMNRVTTDPCVVKVLHGCDSDVVWLQRDFGIYLVNVFDTGQAARLLAFPSFGLAYLLQKFAGVVANKAYQTADWRVRPLSPDMLRYAREDTHYLLGVYDYVKNELIATSANKLPIVVRDPSRSSSDMFTVQEAPALLVSCLNRSAEKTLGVYQKEAWSSTAYRRAMQKASFGGASARAARDEDEEMEEVPPATGSEAGVRSMTGTGVGGSALAAAEKAEPLSTRVFAALFDWRDAAARVLDESPYFVCPPKALARIAESLPSTVTELLRTCAPVTEVVRARIQEVLEVVKAAAEGKPIPTAAGFVEMEAGLSSRSASASGSASSSSAQKGRQGIYTAGAGKGASSAGVKRSAAQAGIGTGVDESSGNPFSRKVARLFIPPSFSVPEAVMAHAMAAPPPVSLAHATATRSVTVQVKQSTVQPGDGMSSKPRAVLQDRLLSFLTSHHPSPTGMDMDVDSAGETVTVHAQLMKELQSASVLSLLGLVRYGTQHTQVAPVPAPPPAVSDTVQFQTEEVRMVKQGTSAGPASLQGSSTDAVVVPGVVNEAATGDTAMQEEEASEVAERGHSQATLGPDGLPLSLLQRYPTGKTSKSNAGSGAGAKAAKAAGTVQSSTTSRKEEPLVTMEADLDRTARAAGLLGQAGIAAGADAMSAVQAHKAAEEKEAKKQAQMGKHRKNPYKK